MTQTCRHCGTFLSHRFLDLGFAPPSNAYLLPEDLNKPEVTYPLRLMVCHHCFLVQTEDYATREAFFDSEYAYFSSTSKSWLSHAATYAEAMIARFGLGPQSQVIEVASNDGYLLRNFLGRVPCLGIEPTAATAAAAEALGIEVWREFFGEALARRLVSEERQADLIAGNNVYAHVPDINDFTRGLCTALKPEGVVTLEFPHLMRMVEFCQFDTAYHEHYSYLSLSTVWRIFRAAGLRVFDVQELPTHGGSLRVYGCRDMAGHSETPEVAKLLAEEVRRGMGSLEYYAAFQSRADVLKDSFLRFLLDAKREGKTVAAYGAAAKGNTLMNYAGIRPDLVPFVSDAALSKQGKLMPGSHIPILPPQALRDAKPDYVVILPWNIAAEVRAQLADLNTSFVTAIPELTIA